MISHAWFGLCHSFSKAEHIIVHFPAIKDVEDESYWVMHSKRHRSNFVIKRRARRKLHAQVKASPAKREAEEVTPLVTHPPKAA